MPSDVLWWMLDHPEAQDLGAIDRHIEYRTELFDAKIYSASRGVNFATLSDAYDDWRAIGRKAGLEFNRGKNTILKLILKVKDENELIDKWIEYHAAIVGYHNIIIMNCVSTDAEFLAKLESYKTKIVVFDYHKYYDYLHHYHANREFYDTLSKDSKFIAVLDADEFIFGANTGFIHPSFVMEILGGSDLAYIGGTWFHNAKPLDEACNGISWDSPISFDIDERQIKWWTYAGKAFVRSDLIATAKYIGHNLGDVNARKLATSDSFGKIGIFHLKTLPNSVVKKRTLRHLVAKNLIAGSLTDASEIETALREKLNSAELRPIETHYIRIYLNLIKPSEISQNCFKTNLICGGKPEKHDLIEMWAKYDYNRMLAELQSSGKI